MKLNLYLIALLVLGCILSCDKEVLNEPPSSFIVLEIRQDVGGSLYFEWSESIDPEGEEIVYDIYLAKDTLDVDYILFDSGRIQRFYSIDGLSVGDWKVRLNARDPTGMITSTFFTTSILVNLPPQDFQIFVEEVTWNSISIHWTEAKDPEDSVVKYSLLLAPDDEDYKLIKQGDTYQDRKWTFDNLDPNTVYRGRLLAIDPNNGISEAFFTAETVDKPLSLEITDGFFYEDEIYIRWENYDTIQDEPTYQVSIKPSNASDDMWEMVSWPTERQVGRIALSNPSQSWLVKVEAFGSNGTNLEVIKEIGPDDQPKVYRGDIEVETAGNFPFSYGYNVIEGNVYTLDRADAFDHVMVVTGYITTAFNVNYRFSTNKLFVDLLEVKGTLTLGLSIETLGPNVYPVLEKAGNLKLSFNRVRNPTGGLDQLQEITGNFTSNECYGGNLSLPSLTRIGGSVSVAPGRTGNSHGLSFLRNVEYIGGSIFLQSGAGHGVNNLSMLDKVSYFGGENIEIYGWIALEDFCGLQKMIIRTGWEGEYAASHNANNPTLQELMALPCE